MSHCAAIHESGHAVVAYHFRRPIRGVRLDPGGAGELTCGRIPLAAQYRMPEALWRRRAVEEAMIAFAGPLAELVACGDYDPSACADDLENGRRWIRRGAADPVAAFRDTIDRLRADWPAVEAVAARLLRAGSLDGRLIASTIARASARGRPAA